MTACPHGFPTPLSCTECMWDGNLPPAPKPQHEWSRPFPARYDGVCRVCQDEIVRGDLIRLNINEGGTAHDTCADEVTA